MALPSFAVQIALLSADSNMVTGILGKSLVVPVVSDTTRYHTVNIFVSQ
jgi:hypothetical protein